MLKTLFMDDTASAKAIERIINRASDEEDVEPRVRQILEAVRQRSDEALLEYTEKFDGVRLTSNEIKVTEDEIKNATKRISAKAKQSIRGAKERIEAFHKKEIRDSWQFKQEDGTMLGQLVRPLESVGLYVPGGDAPYPSSVLMTAVPAVTAGVARPIMVTPPNKEGGVSPYVLYAAGICSIKEIYKIGGAQAIGALAFGTATVPKVDKIVGPGNVYVNVAKRLVYGEVDIDALAGPSEIVVLAEEGANPSFVAADLLSQAEHDPFASAILITSSRALAEAVTEEITLQIGPLSRRAVITSSLKRRGAIIVVNDLEEGIDLANKIAPEHLEVMVENPLDILPQLRNAGMVLLGEYSPVPLCDYGAGPNHVLPTGGAARFSSPLSVDDFVKKTNVIACTEEALASIGDQVETLAKIEGFTAHAASIKLRRIPTDG